MNEDIYSKRPLSALYPDIERLGAEYHAKHHEEETLYTPMIVDCLDQLISIGFPPGKALVIGCGPKPRAVVTLAERGFEVTGLEPVPDNVATAQAFCASTGTIVQGSVEDVPFESESYQFVLMESVLEHVDSVPQSLNEMFRILAPGGVLYVYTTNRYRISASGFNGEYRTPFLNWFPRIVKECYVHQHLHFDPELANYNARPAVHWFTYDELCAAGRSARFARFYTLLDLVPEHSLWARSSRLRGLLVKYARRNPWLRALALTQAGSSVFMVKRG